jgi:hypothetical protein
MILAPVPLSLDGPSHLNTALVIRHLFADNALFQEHFRFASALTPNWLASVIAAVIAIPASARWSLTVMNTFVILLSVLALYFLVKRSGIPPPSREHRFYVLTILMPLAVNGFLTLGFWGFLISADLCFIALGLLQHDRLVWRRIVSPMLVLLGFWAHPVPVLLTGLIPALGYARAVFQLRGSVCETRKTLNRRFALDILPWCGAVFVIIMFAFTLAPDGKVLPVNLLSQIDHRMKDFAGSEAFRLLSPTPTVLGLFIIYAAMLLVGFVASYGMSHLFRWQLTVFVGTLAVLYFIVPEKIGNGGFIPERVLWIAIAITCVVSISGRLTSNTWYLRSCATCAAIITVLFALQYIQMSIRMEPALEELRVASAKVAKQSKTLLLTYRLTPQCARSPLLQKTSPENHWALLETIPRELIILNEYQPGTMHFPVEYRDLRFFSITGPFKSTVEQETAWRRTLASAEAGTIVLSWGVPSGSTGCGSWVEAPLADTLRRLYELRYENANQSRVQVWERRRT